MKRGSARRWKPIWTICLLLLAAETTAWWYELEKGPRFGRGLDAVVRVRAFAAADAKAQRAKALRASAAVDAVWAALRAKAPEGAEVRLVATTFDKVGVESTVDIRARFL